MYTTTVACIQIGALNTDYFLHPFQDFEVDCEDLCNELGVDCKDGKDINHFQYF